MGTVKHLISVFLFFLESLISFFSGSKLHTARFANSHELSGLATETFNGAGLLLGVSGLGRLLSVQPTGERPELGNMLIVAPTRGGKGLLATSQLLSWPHSVVVNDIKGELFLQTAGYRSRLGPVFVIDPTGVGNRLDPLAGRVGEDQLFSSATHLLQRAEEGEGRIFTERATVMLTQIFQAARLEDLSPFPYTRAIVGAGLETTAARLNFLSPELATGLLDTQYEAADFTDRFLLSSWGTLAARMRPLLTETVVRSLAGSDFSPRSLMQGVRPVTLHLRWPERDLPALSPLVRLLWGSIVDELITVYDGAQGSACRPVLLLIDEAGRSAIPSLSDHATTVVGRGISLWVAVQDLAQLDAVYGKTRARVLRNNMESQIYYRPSDQQTADYLEHCLGRRSEYARSKTEHNGTETSLGLSEQAVPLMPSQDIKQMGDREVIGFHRNLPPFRASRMDWRHYPALARRRSIPPPPVSGLLPVSASLRDNPGAGEAPTPPWKVDPDLLKSPGSPGRATRFGKKRSA